MTSPSPLTAAELDAIKARVEGARPGPWSVIDTLDDYPVEYGNHWVVANPEDQEDDTFHVSLDVGAEEDAQFIAHARSDVPALLATVRHLRDLLAEAERDRDHARDEASEEKATARSLRVEADRLAAQVAALHVAVQGRETALGEIKMHAVTTAAANDLIRKDRDEIRTAAMAREAALTRLADRWETEAAADLARLGEPVKGYAYGRQTAYESCLADLRHALGSGAL